MTNLVICDGDSQIRIVHLTDFPVLQLLKEESTVRITEDSKICLNQLRNYCLDLLGLDKRKS